jgi:type III pantothenate kinase
MILLIDVGNTRVKWAVLGDKGLGPLHAESHAGWDTVAFRTCVLAGVDKVDRVLVANVGGERLTALIRQAVFESWGLVPEFLQASVRAGGIRNAYIDPQKLGIDRWTAMIGAYELVRRPVCVVGVGTAMTVDGVDASGQHLGGLIAPGPDLMISSLMLNTSDIAIRSQDGRLGDGLFADNTLGAVHQGAVHALAALVDKSLATLTRQCGVEPALIMTGGAANRIEPHATGPVQLVPDLVLRGLAVLSRTNGPIPVAEAAV